MVSVTSIEPNRIQPYLIDSPLAEVVEIEIVSKTLIELESDQALATQLMYNLGIDGASGIIGQRVLLYTPTPELLVAALRDAHVALPESVDIVEEALPVEDYNYLAGFGLSPVCTSGYIGFHSATNEKGVFTAGHCGGLGCCNYTFTHAAGHTLQFRVDYNSGSRDWQFNANTTPNALRSMVNIGNTWLPVTGMTNRSNQVVGSIVCKYGKITHYDCGVLMERNYHWGPNLPNFNATWMRAQKNGQAFTTSGDSGGPFFMPTGSPPNLRVNAYGIYKGSNASNTVYMAINYIYPSHGIFMNCSPDWYC